MTIRILMSAALAASLAAPAFAQEATPAPSVAIAQPAPQPDQARTPPPAPSRAEQAPPPQTPKATPPTAVAPAEPRRGGQPLNIKVDVTITEQRGSAAPTKKTVSIVVADGMFGAIRSQSDVYQVANQMPLNIDAEPQIINLPIDGRSETRIRLRLNVQYDLPSPVETQGGASPPRGSVLKTQLHDNLTLILENGKSIVAAQSVDPVGDRRVTVDVTASILR